MHFLLLSLGWNFYPISFIMDFGQQCQDRPIPNKFINTCSLLFNNSAVQVKRIRVGPSTREMEHNKQKYGLKLTQPLKTPKYHNQPQVAIRMQSQRLTMKKIKEQIRDNDQKLEKIQKNIQTMESIMPDWKIKQWNNNIDYKNTPLLSFSSKIKSPQIKPLSQINSFRISIPIQPEKSYLIDTKFSTTGRLSQSNSKLNQQQAKSALQAKTMPEFEQEEMKIEGSGYKYSRLSQSQIQSNNQIRRSRLHQYGIQQIESESQSRMSFRRSTPDKILILQQSQVDWTYETGFKSAKKLAQQKKI